MLNEKFIEAYKGDENNTKKYLAIKKILSYENCFLNMNIESAYAILRDLGIAEEDLKKIYLSLIEPPKKN